MLKKYPIFEISLTLIFIAVIVGGAFSDGANFPLRWFERDDAYYYFKVAQNISEGRGSTFDGINLTNGYHPLWMVACIPIFAFARYDLILPLRVLFVVMGMLHLFTALYLYALLKRVVSVPVAMFCAGFWAFDALIDSSIYQQGLETGLAAFFIVLLIYTLARKEEKWEHEPANRKDIIALAVLATLVMFSRLDLVFLAVLMGLRIVFRRTTLKDLLAIDLLFIAASVLISFLARLDLPQYYNYSNAAIVMVGVSLLVRIPVLYFFGLYENNSQRSMIVIIRRSFLVVALGSLIITPLMLVASSLLGFDGFPRMVLVYDLVIAFLYTVFSRLAAYWFSNKRSSQTPLEFMQKNWKRWLADGALYYGIVLGSLFVYMLFNHLAFGASSPVSGQVKRWWGSHSINVYTGAEITKLDFFGISPETEYNTMPQLTNWVRSFSGIVFEQNPSKPGWQYRYSWTFFYLFVLTVIVFSFNRAYISRAFTRLSLLFLFAASGLQIFSYNAGGYAGVKEWYWAAQYILFILFCAVLIDYFAQHLLRFKGGFAFLWLIAISLSVLRADQFITRVNSTLSYRTNSVDALYTEAVSFLEEHTPPRSLIGMTGGGNVGYFIHDRTIINMDGLINSPQYFNALQSQSADNFLADIGLDYIFANPDILNSVPYRSQFNNLYEKDIARFGGKVLIEIKQDLK